jgi:arginyl-tRNA synthetase
MKASAAMPARIEDLLGKIAKLALSPRQAIRIEYRSGPDAPWDVKVIFGDPAVLPGLLDLLHDRSIVKQLDLKGASAFIRFEDKYLAGEIDRTLAGNADCFAAGPFQGQRMIVQFLDPNSTKAMHLGHLYEGILGSALAALLRRLGADVSCYCFVSDISRSVCEAMAGFETLGNQKTPAQLGEKPDHMVGRLYAQYAEQYYAQHPDEAGNEDPIRRETGVVGDRADDFMRLYRAGDGETRALWRKIRDWVMAGQLATLSRLHVNFDTIQFGSDFDQVIEDFIVRGLQHRVLEREPSGAVVYHSGKREYQTVVVTRPDGFPTEHTRQMAQMISVLARCRSLDRYYTFMGMEWKPAWMIYEDILRGCGESPYHDIVEPVCHGMVMVEGSKMKSSNGAALLADEFLDQVESLREVHALAAQTDHRVSVATVSDIVVKSFFLSRRMAKDLNFAWSQVISSADNPGWSIASAWCAAHSRHHAARPRADELELARTLFFKGFDLVRALNFAANEIDFSVAVKFLHRFSETVNTTLAAAGNDRLSALARFVLGNGLTSVGMLGAGAAASAAASPPRRGVG